MKKPIIFLILIFLNYGASKACDKCGSYNNTDFKIKTATITHKADLGLTVWDIKVEGTAGKTVPKPVGQLNGAPVLAYVFRYWFWTDRRNCGTGIDFTPLF